MKRILLATASLLISATTMAQLPVSTSPSNKNVVLEEFTGIYCVYCPDGHRIASEIRDANPNDVFLINVHTGGYAAPSGGDPDFRTNFGTSLAGQSGLTGYPSGTVNRHVFTGNATAMGRGSWTQAAGIILGESSYVNVALDASIDMASRVMTVDLEAYFTANGASKMNINVVVTQNNVEGPQTGASNFNPGNILPNGNYNHQHMLRHMITGQWGDEITTTSSGNKVTKQYTWAIPADINGIPVKLTDLQVIGFIVEGRQELITGAEGPVTFVAPAGFSIVDFETYDNTTAPTATCDVLVKPSVQVTNHSTEASKGYEVYYSYAPGDTVKMVITNSLAGGATVTHDFTDAMFTGGDHIITYGVNALDANNEIEVITENNECKSSKFSTFTFDGAKLSIAEGFESALEETVPAGISTSGSISGMFAVNLAYLKNLGTTTGNSPVGGSGLSAQSFMVPLRTANAGSVGSLYLDKLDLTDKKNATLTFDHAYTSWQGSLDKLEVLVSTDCGVSWTSVWSKSGSSLKTAPEVNISSVSFSPKSTQWVNNSVDLSAYFNHHVLVQFKVTSDNGNSLFLDNLNVNGTTTGIEPLFGDNMLSVFPNPAVNNTTLSVRSSETQIVTIRVHDLAGKTIMTISNQTLVAGSNTIEINTSNFNNGVYFIEVSSNSKVSTQRLVIQK